MNSIAPQGHVKNGFYFITHSWRLLGICAVVGLCLQSTFAAPYQYPSHLPQRTLKFGDWHDPSSLGVHHCIMIVEPIDGKYLPSGTLPALHLHYCRKDGNDASVKLKTLNVAYKKKGEINEVDSISFRWQMTISEVHKSLVDSFAFVFTEYQKIDEIMRCYISCDNGDASWVSQEFGIHCGGKGKHSHCNQCFMIVTLPKTQTMAEATAERLKRLDQGAQKPNEPKVAATHAPLLPHTADELVGQELRLQSDIVIYSLTALPRPEAMGELKTGMTLQVVRSLSPTLLHVKFTTSKGHTYEGVAKLSSLQQTVPVTPLATP